MVGSHFRSDGCTYLTCRCKLLLGIVQLYPGLILDEFSLCFGGLLACFITELYLSDVNSVVSIATKSSPASSTSSTARESVSATTLSAPFLCSISKSNACS